MERLIVFLFIVFAIGTKAEVFTSLASMEKMLEAEHDVAHRIREYILAEKKRLDTLDEIASEMEKHSSEALVSPEDHLSNPVNSFLLVKRLTTDWNKVIDDYLVLDNKISSAELQNIYEAASVYPEKVDLQGAALGLTRIQDVYALESEAIASGSFTKEKSPQFTAGDCFEVGKQVYFQNDHYHSILWMEEAMDRLERETEKTAEKKVILDYLSFSYSQFSSMRKALNLTNDWLALEPGHERAIANRLYYERIIAEADDAEKLKLKGDTGVPVVDGQPFRFLTDYTGSKSYSDYEKLCRGEETHERTFKHKLVCRYRRYHPIFYLSPLKEEMLNLDPALYVYHDVLTNAQNDLIKEVSRPKLHRSGVFSKTDADTGLSNYRTSQTAWHDDTVHPLIARLSQMSSAISNLTLETVEHLQVLNYGIGGLYEPHWDFVQGEEQNEFSDHARNRVATFICYLSELEAGGYTVYPTLGAAVVPRKNSCALWFNLMRNGDGDFRTYHAACPILYGYKWVANKWFHEGGQEFVRSCGMSEEE